MKKYCGVVMWVYILIALLVIYAIYKERQALGCPSFPDGTDCNNQNGKAVFGSKPHPQDSEYDLYERLKRAGSYKDRFVYWRVALIGAVVSALLLWFILYQKIPTEWELVVLILVISSVSYFIDNFYKFHLVDHVKKNIYSTVGLLKGPKFGLSSPHTW